MSLPLVIGVPTLLEDVCLIVHDSLLELMSNAPSDSYGDLPLVYSTFLERFLGILIGLPQVSDNDTSCPLAYRRFVIGSVFPLEVILFIERVFVHWMFVV